MTRAVPAIRDDAAEVIRSHIERITLTLDGQGGLEVRLHGNLAHILQFCAAGAGARVAEAPASSMRIRSEVMLYEH